MQELYELFPVWMDLLDRGLALGADYLSGAAGPIGLLGYLPPLLLVLLSRRPLHMLLVVVLTIMTLGTLRLDAPALGLVLHAMSYVLAVHAFVARAERRRADLAAAQLTRLHREVTAFLDGLDRRTRDADHLRPAPAAAPQVEREERERA